MRYFNSLMNDVEGRKNLVRLKNPEESFMARRCKFGILTCFKVGSVDKNQRTCLVVKSSSHFLSEGGCIQTIQNLIFKCSDYSRSTQIRISEDET